MDSALKVDIDKEMSAEIGTSHERTVYRCVMYNAKNARKCPHGHDIPRGKCWQKPKIDFK